jgi:putative MATE family efflux protein
MGSENKMGSMRVSRLLISMSAPMMASMMVQALYNIVDSIFVARLGEKALTAVSLAFPAQMLSISAAVGTGVGLTPLLSKSLGEKNFKLANKTAGNGVFLALVSSLLLGVLGLLFAAPFFASQTRDSEITAFGVPYLTIAMAGSIFVFMQIMYEKLLASTGKAIASMAAQIAGAVTNIILDPIMIFGLLGFPKLGTAGAAIATIIGQLVGAIVAISCHLAYNHELKLKAQSYAPEWAVIKKIYQVGLPSIVMQAIGSFMIYGLNRILISFTAAAAAVLGVYFKLQSFVFMPVFGLNNGMVPIIAYNYGAGSKKRVMGIIKLSITYALVIMSVGAMLFLIFPAAFLAMFNASPEMLAIGKPAMRIIAIHFIPAAICVILISVFQALGNGLETLMVSTARQLIVLLPAAWLFSLSGQVWMVWWAFPVSEIASLIMCLLILKKVYNIKIKHLGEVMANRTEGLDKPAPPRLQPAVE